jgi:VWFA-related protein
MPRTVCAVLFALAAAFSLRGTARALEAPGPYPDSRLPAGEPEHYFILLFDYPAGGLHQIEELSTAVENWVGSRMRPTDAVAVASYYGCELQVEQDFTLDRTALAGAIADAVRGRGRASLASSASGSLPALLERLPGGEELARRTANFYGLLQVLAEATAGIPGRKNLLLFSKGFGRSYLLDAETSQAANDEAEPAAALASPIQEKYLTDRQLYEPTLAALKEARISLYPVDLATDYRETYPLAGVMCQLAAGTGGRYFYPASDVPGLFDRVVADEIAEGPAETGERMAGSSPAPKAAVDVTVKGRE